ncbi:MAG: phycocyanin alpha phycocyanobilin lyase [Chloroflexi bacterium]|nr:phycocyanin alpha phycocyanobilin lyase [Chloroflexota bacterium]MBM3153858.1 phycocyanin alpha phycocyanobilin lyase [Chloroflexota bacterium]MBM3165847.1 phycocyanin alpha phycocyanobilin lyase [Chloroflexota bacterium]MBM3173139.1 phycocyanin alpha phycocyanobilin lyase [Chloroflexota bacterium]MBM4449291.1 phycocyanin alpha phycocyanobilin lyase [Chloroflexota bacterium]
MTAEASPKSLLIADILDPNKHLKASKLALLSDLSNNDLQVLKLAWANSGTERQQQVISGLVHLSETDFRLNFTNIFLFCLGDPDEQIRRQAVIGLEIEEDEAVIAPLTKVLKEDRSASVRAAAATSLSNFSLLAELGKLATVHTDKIYSTLLQVLDNQAENTEVKRQALEAIAPLSKPRVKELIEHAYHSKDLKLKASAIYAMGRNCDRAWLEPLLSELSNSKPEMRYNAAAALGELGAEEAVPQLSKLTTDEDVEVQEAAIKAIGEIGGDQAKKILKRLTKTQNVRICEAATAALKELLLCEDPLSQEI